MNILINVNGFIGDCCFSSCLAKLLKQQYPECKIYYSISVVQPLILLRENPDIDGVMVGMPKITTGYDKIIHLPEVNQMYPATIWYQKIAGIPDELQNSEFKIYTIPENDVQAKELIDDLRTEGKTIIAYQVDWAWRAYQCSQETLTNGIGAPHRNMTGVIKELEKDFILIPIGYDRTINQYDPIAADPEAYARTTSVVKQCDYYIGAEGGSQNLAAGVGTKTIITSDYIAQNFWRNGRIKKIEIPKMGSTAYFSGAGHSLLHPCIKDEEIADKIRNIINNNQPEVFDWNTPFSQL